MRIAVFGGTGRAGKRIVERLSAAGHHPVAASPSSGANTLTGKGLDAALAGADALIDATDASRGDPVNFFTQSTHTLLEHASRHGVRHHVLLSVVGADRMPEARYMRAKAAQEALVRQSGIAHTIVRATQFHDFIPELARVFTVGGAVRVPDADMQPVALTELAGFIAAIVASRPANGIVEIGGPEVLSIADAITRMTGSGADPLRVEPDADVLYFGARLRRDTLLPGPGALLGQVKLGRGPGARVADQRRTPPVSS